MENVFKTKFFKEMIQFASVGAVSTAIDYVLLNLAHQNFNASIYLATFIGFLGGSINGYLANNTWTFAHRNLPMGTRGLAQYSLVGLVGLGLTELIMHILAVRADINYNLAKLVAVFIVFFWNFLANRYWTFGIKK